MPESQPSAARPLSQQVAANAATSADHATRVAAVLAADALRKLATYTFLIRTTLGPTATADKVAAVREALHGLADDIAASVEATT